MLWSVDRLRHCLLYGSDGARVQLKDLLFDDRTWAVRHVVAGKKDWFGGDDVLLPPGQIDSIDRVAGSVRVGLSAGQIAASARSETDKPVSRRRTEAMWPCYAGVGPGVVGPLPIVLTPPPEDTGDPHLRSARAVLGYRVVSVTEVLGRVVDYLAEEGTWRIRYLVIRVGPWFSRRTVLVASRWITGVSWCRRSVMVGLHRDVLSFAPAFDRFSMLGSEHDSQLARVYEDLGYWFDLDETAWRRSGTAG